MPKQTQEACREVLGMLAEHLHQATMSSALAVPPKQAQEAYRKVLAMLAEHLPSG